MLVSQISSGGTGQEFLQALLGHSVCVTAFWDLSLSKGEAVVSDAPFVPGNWERWPELAVAACVVSMVGRAPGDQTRVGPKVPTALQSAGCTRGLWVGVLPRSLPHCSLPLLETDLPICAELIVQVCALGAKLEEKKILKNNKKRRSLLWGAQG